MVIAAKECGETSSNILTNGKFLRLFAIPILLHALWDSPLSNIGADIYLLPILLTFIVWVVVLILINMGLSEIAKNKMNY